MTIDASGEFGEPRNDEPAGSDPLGSDAVPAGGPSIASEASNPRAGGEPEETPSSLPDSPFPPEPPDSSRLLEEDGRGGRTFLGSVRDNLEAIAFALILALLLRHFCLEVFKIPTASMEPTLFGDSSETHPKTAGDRIVVDKLAYVFSGPKRWDVVVFHYPLDYSRNFIKRVAVLPDEVFQILRGDVWVAEPPPEGQAPRFHAARKPRSVREQLYVPIWPSTSATYSATPALFWRADANTTGLWKIDSPTEFSFSPAESLAPGIEAQAVLKYGYTISDSATASQPSQTYGQAVPDIRWKATVLATGPADLEIQWRPGDGRQHVLKLAAEGRAPSVLRTRDSEYTLGRPLRPGRKMTVELESVDGDVHAWVDGDEVKVVADEKPFAEVLKQEEGGQPEGQELSITARGAPLKLSNVRLDRDLYYGNYSDGTSIPERGNPRRTGSDQYFMLGDNTMHSSDSRRWTAHGHRLPSGETVWWDSQTAPRKYQQDGAWWREVTDVEGVTRRWAVSEIDTGSDASWLTNRMPFVTRDRIVGRAFFALVFWPFDDAFLDRIRFIH